MELNAIIEEMQGCIFSLQQRVEELKGMDDKSAETILLTRQEAADLLGNSIATAVVTASARSQPMAASVSQK